MPISFRPKSQGGYFATTYSGHVSHEEQILAFERFLSGSDWIPCLNELAIASEASSTSISRNSLRSLITLKNNHYQKHGVKYVKIAICAPGDLAFGIARMYDMIAETERSPEDVMAFRDIKEAIRWLRTEIDPPDSPVNV